MPPAERPRRKAPPTPKKRPGRPRRIVTDPRVIRALAHPVRVELLDAIHREGEITASRAAELLGDSPGNMSWHLQTLAKYGFIEEAGGGRGRSRPWRSTREQQSFDTGSSDPEAAAAGEALERTILDRNYERMREWWAERRGYSVKWREASFITYAVTYLTDDELVAVSEEIRAIFGRYEDRRDRDKRPPDARPVHLFAQGHPVRPTPRGN
ncbi:MAG: winged helix-turn-helix domain-containing protein [Solirubrobacteraceae bacterium]